MKGLAAGPTACRVTVGGTPGTSELQIESTLVYITSVSRFVRTCIERGADSGMGKNFAQYTALLGKTAAVTDLSKALKRSASQPVLKARTPAHARVAFCWGQRHVLPPRLQLRESRAAQVFAASVCDPPHQMSEEVQRTPVLLRHVSG